MKKIELTSLELQVLKQDVAGDFNEMTASPEEAAALNSVINKAEALMAELDAYDELGNSLMEWYLNKYQAQENSGSEAEPAQ